MRAKAVFQEIALVNASRDIRIQVSDLIGELLAEEEAAEEEVVLNVEGTDECVIIFVVVILTKSVCAVVIEFCAEAEGVDPAEGFYGTRVNARNGSFFIGEGAMAFEG